ncbi:hypothetical protein ACE6H2_000847 [Prunus campanulata]
MNQIEEPDNTAVAEILELNAELFSSSLEANIEIRQLRQENEEENEDEDPDPTEHKDKWGASPSAKRKKSK